MEDLGIFFGGSGSKLTDQIEILNSRRLMEEVVKDLNLNIQYFSEGNVKNLENYIAPVIVSFLNQDTLYHQKGTTTFKLTNNKNGSFRLSSSKEKETVFKYGQSIDLGYGSFNIIPRSADNDTWDDILVRITPIKSAAAAYAAQVKVVPKGKNTNVLLISMKNAVEQKSRDIINTLIEQYNEDTKKDKNQVATNTANFIANRLTIISRELDSVETSKERFKRENRLTDIPTEASLIVNSDTEIKKRIMDVATQIAMNEDIKNYIDVNKTGLLPENLGALEGRLSSQVNAYNNLILQRDDLLISSTAENPVIKTLDEELDKTRNTILQGISNGVVIL